MLSITSNGQTMTIQRRRLAAQLRDLRHAAGVSIDQTAKALECSSSKISRIETGQVGVTPRDVRDMLALYGVEGRERDALLDIARKARQREWWYQFRDLREATIVSFEAAAASLRTYELTRIPVLLQTDDYARATLRARRPAFGAEAIARNLELRRARKDLLFQDSAPTLWAIIDEAALHRLVGGHEVMTMQLEHLARVTELSTVTLQVLPFSAGEHAGMDGPFTIISFSQPTDSTIVHVETAARYLDHESPQVVEQYIMLFDHIRASALSPDSSTIFVADVLAKMYR
jgi:transcriptional regulator with XRE-family HTH domain